MTAYPWITGSLLSRFGMVLLLLIPTLVPSPARAQDPAAALAGEWTGVWTRATDTLTVAMRFERTEAGWRGSFDAERLRVEGIPFTDVTYDDPVARFRIVGDATTIVFEGRIAGDSLTGTLDESGAPGTIAFARAAPPAELPQEEVRFRNGEVELAGTLLLPSGPGPHAAVVFLHGSGPEGRWASRFLARRLARAGVATLIYDKRGVSESPAGGRTRDSMSWPPTPRRRSRSSEPAGTSARSGSTATARGGRSRRWRRSCRTPIS